MTQPRPRRDAGRAGRRPARRFAGHGGTGPSWWPRPARTSIGAPLGPDLHQAQPHDLDRGRDDVHGGRCPAWRPPGRVDTTGPTWWPRLQPADLVGTDGPDLDQVQPHDLDRGRDDGHDAAPRSGGRGNELHHLSTQQTKKTVLLTVLFLDQGKNINEINIKTP